MDSASPVHGAATRPEPGDGQQAIGHAFIAETTTPRFDMEAPNPRRVIRAQSQQRMSPN
jgi:hypothetical protein